MVRLASSEMHKSLMSLTLTNVCLLVLESSNVETQ